MVIRSHVVIHNNTVSRNSVPLPLPGSEALAPELLYTQLQCNYPKFYKMDMLCKWAVVAAEYLFAGQDLYTGIDKNKIAIVLGTAHGCLDVDKRYYQGIDMPSPALFVYTLPNIMLGELCIRHGFKGEQLCLVSEKFDKDELFFTASGFLQRGMDACLAGWVDVTPHNCDIQLYWITKR